MSFDYDKMKQSQHNSDSFWTSYSDLFLGLSTIFLLLYVTSSLRTGTDAIKSQVENQKLTMQVQELESQLKMYEQVKSNYLDTEAPKSEVEEYQELMDKLTLLQEESKDEKEKLARAALEHERKAGALNKYQQMVRNIINANKVAKTKLIARNDIIEEQDTTIDVQKQNIDQLETDVQQKQAEIQKNEKQIAAAKSALQRSKKQLLDAFQANQITKQAFEEKTRQLQEQSEQRIARLNNANENLAEQLKGTQTQLRGTEAQLKGTEAALAQKTGEAEGLQGRIAALRASHQADLARQRAALDAEIRKGQMDSAERARREGELRDAAVRKEQELAGKIAGLQGQLKNTEGRLAGVQGQLKNTEGALAKAKEEIDARREVAREIQKGFQKAGIKADIDMQTGEVVLDFGDHYFDSDSAKLKEEMKDIIERAMPVYSQSLFGNPKVANKISAVEVIGFASPTYKGRYVDPRSKKSEDKAALKYNMDLSYRRANSIFNYLLESSGPEFEHQRNLLALMKVSGRSFLEVMNVKERGPATASDFCKMNDCKKAQRVIVRFSMDGKK